MNPLGYDPCPPTERFNHPRHARWMDSDTIWGGGNPHLGLAGAQIVDRNCLVSRNQMGTPEGATGPHLGPSPAPVRPMDFLSSVQLASNDSPRILMARLDPKVAPHFSVSARMEWPGECRDYHRHATAWTLPMTKCGKSRGHRPDGVPVWSILLLHTRWGGALISNEFHWGSEPPNAPAFIPPGFHSSMALSFGEEARDRSSSIVSSRDSSKGTHASLPYRARHTRIWPEIAVAQIPKVTRFEARRDRKNPGSAVDSQESVDGSNLNGAEN